MPKNASVPARMQKGEPLHPRLNTCILAAMSEIDAYFAGLLDGEGTFFLEAKPNTTAKVPLIQANMTDEAVIRELQQTYGGRFASKKVYNGNKPQWVWRVKHAQARATLLRLYPYLKVKKSAADRMLAYWGIAKRGG